MEVLIISLGRGILDPESRERERMRGYGAHLKALHVIVLSRREHGYAAPQSDGPLTIYPTNSRSRIGMLIDAYRIGRRVSTVKRDTPLIISAQDPLELGWLSFLLAKKPNTRLHIQVHGDYFGRGWVGYSPVRWLKLLFARLLLLLAPAVRVVSERIKRSLILRGVKEEKITVLPIRPELEAFLGHTASVETASPFTFLYAGRLAPEKDVARILRAFAFVHRNNPTARLRIVGKGEEEAALKKLARTLGISPAVTFASWTEDVAGEMERAQVFLLASKHEAYGLVLLEAMAVGLPTVTTDVGCVGEVFVHERHGLVVYKEGAPAFAEAMERMVRDESLRKRCGEEGKETARKLALTSAEAYAHAWVNALKKSLM